MTSCLRSDQSDEGRTAGNGSRSMGDSLERPASRVRQISEGISLSARSSAGGNLGIDAVAVPDTMALTVLGVMRRPLRTMRRGPLRRQAAVGRGHGSRYPEQSTKPCERASYRSLHDDPSISCPLCQHCPTPPMNCSTIETTSRARTHNSPAVLSSR
jgi:hypothetical protein